MTPRWAKVFADLGSNRSRSALVVLCIAIGVIAVGLIEGARQLLMNNLAASYAAAQPATITLTVSPFDESLLKVVRRMDGVQAAEARTLMSVRVRGADGVWRDVRLFASADFPGSHVNRLLPVQGAYPPPPNTLALERSSFAFLRAQLGESLLLELPNGKQAALPIAGVVHDLNQASTFLLGSVFAYVTPETLTQLDLPNDSNVLLIRTDENQPRAKIVALAAQVRAELVARGYEVRTTFVPAVPGRLFFADSVQSMLLLLGALGVVSLLSSAVLVVTTMSGLLAQQVREIGVMKAIGARSQTLLQMYLAMVLLLGLCAILVAIPLGALGAFLLVTFSTELLNLLPVTFEIVPGALLVQIVAGLLIPLLAALPPVISASGITVRQAITSYGLGGGNFGTSRLDALIERLRTLPRPLLLSLRNAFRRKGRLALTLGTLIVSGAVFMAVLSVRASLFTTLAEMDAFRRSDADVLLASPQRIARVEREIKTVPGVTRVESWGWGEMDMFAGAADRAERVEVYGVPLTSDALKPILLQGRWFVPDDKNAMVIDAEVWNTNPDLNIGDRVVLRNRNDKSTWQIIGVASNRLLGPLTYVPYEAWTRTRHENGLTERVQVFMDADASQADVLRAVEAQLKSKEIDVVSARTSADARASTESNFGSIIGFLAAMGILLAVVGGLGLMGTMSLSVLERTREIGVLRAIGAPSPSLMQIVLVEGVLIALLSFPLAALLSLPLSLYLADLVGRELVQSRLTYAFSFEGLGVWLALLVLIAMLASAVPAVNVIRLTVRNALVYE